MKRILTLCLALVVCAACCTTAPTDSELRTVGNPFLPLWEHIPDGEPHIFEDPDHPGTYRLYLYGSHDSRRTAYCGRELVVWSAALDGSLPASERDRCNAPKIRLLNCYPDSWEIVE